jgi:hypothetical protein
MGRRALVDEPVPEFFDVLLFVGEDVLDGAAGG